MRADARIRLWKVICAVALAVVLVVGGAAQNVQAKLITFNFEGIVKWVGKDLAGTFNVGDKLSGSYTFDSATPDYDVTNPKIGEYYALKILNFTVGTYTGTLGAGEGIQRFIRVVDNYDGVDWYQVLDRPFSGPDVGGLPPFGFNFYLADTTHTVFSSDALPIAPPNLLLFNQNIFDVRFGEEESPCLETDGSCNLWGTITSLTLGVTPDLTDPILEFFDDSVVEGDLRGSGTGRSANNRLNALRNMIEEAENLIEGGFIAEACQQLMDAYKKTDGNPRPPDLVQGTAASGLASMIQDLRIILGCQ